MNADKTNLIYYLPGSKERTLLMSSTIKVIKDYAFHSCLNLYEVMIPIGNLVQIGYQSFMNCTHLTRIYLPPSVEIINQQAFEGCINLKCGCVNIPEQVLTNLQKNNIDLSSIGIDQSLLTGYCKEVKCYISFEQLSCNIKPCTASHYFSSLFIVIGSSSR